MSSHVLRLPSAPSPLSFDDHGEGPPVVLLHGQPGAAATWRPVVELLRGEVRMIALDRPGYGATGGRAVGIEQNAAVLGELLDRLELPAATLVGHSWGGGVALRLAQGAPERVAGLVLVASIGVRASVDALDALLARPAIGPALTYAAFRTLPRLLPLGVTRRVVPGLGNLTPDALADLVGTLHERRDWRSFLVEQRALVREIDGLDARVGEIRAPTEVLIGESDFLLHPKTARELAARIAGARCRTVPGAGHVLPVEAPEAVADAVRDVVARAAERPRQDSNLGPSA